MPSERRWACLDGVLGGSVIVDFPSLGQISIRPCSAGGHGAGGLLEDSLEASWLGADAFVAHTPPCPAPVTLHTQRDRGVLQCVDQQAARHQFQSVAVPAAKKEVSAIFGRMETIPWQGLL